MFDLAALRAATAHGPVARIVIAGVKGSSPRELGAAMLVWADGQSGSIGGGALEWQAMQRARVMLAKGGRRHFETTALGPNIGQCCGGAVSLLTEVYSADSLPQGPLVARPLEGAPMPLGVKRLLAKARNSGSLPATQVLQGWLIEPITTPQRQIWIWGAGHVGRALAEVLAPLPQLALTWVDVAVERFPDAPPPSRILPVPAPECAVTLAPQTAEHLIVTYSHALDLELCHRLLHHGFGFCGLIGSASKAARFRSRLAALGHSPQAISRILCPIGDPALGKAPHAIAIGVAAQMLRSNFLSQRSQCSI